MSKSPRSKGRVELGRYTVADPAICHGKPTFTGTRVFAADVLADVERGLSWDFIVERWGGGKITKAAVRESFEDVVMLRAIHEGEKSPLTSRRKILQRLERGA